MTSEWAPWREAMERALYGPAGFFRRPEGPAGHFRTSVHVSPLYAGAVAELLARVDEALGHPEQLSLIDMGAGRGELTAGVLDRVPRSIEKRLLPYAVERAARPQGLDERIRWTDTPPTGVTGLLFANEWLDDVPLDIAETDEHGVPRYVLVRESDGAERLGAPVGGADTEWLERWWPIAGEPGARAEIGRPRDAAWAAVTGTVARGVAVAVDYAHQRGSRPPFGTLTGFRAGREVRPVPDGSCDVTCHVALDACADACAAAGSADAGGHVGPAEGVGSAGEADDVVVLKQREALRALGVDGRRPPLAVASRDPAAYVRGLAAAGEAAELVASGGLGDFGWLVRCVRLPRGLGSAELFSSVGRVDRP